MYCNIGVYQKYLVPSIKVGCATRSLYACSGPKAEGVPTNNQGDGPQGPMTLWPWLNKQTNKQTWQIQDAPDHSIWGHKKRHILRSIHYTKSDVINNMDRNQKPSSVNLNQTNKFKVLKSDAPSYDLKVPQQAEAKRDGVINHKITISNNFNTENFDALKRYESTMCVFFF